MVTAHDSRAAPTSKAEAPLESRSESLDVGEHGNTMPRVGRTANSGSDRRLSRQKQCPARVGACMLVGPEAGASRAFGGRRDNGNDVAAVAPLDREVGSIERHHATLSNQFGHTHDARVGQIHLAVRGTSSGATSTAAACSARSNARTTLARVNHLHDGRWPSGHGRRLRNRLGTRVKRRTRAEPGSRDAQRW